MSQALLSIRAKCETNRVTGTRHFFPSLCSAEGNEGGEDWMHVASRGNLTCFFKLVNNVRLHSNMFGNAKHPDDWLQCNYRVEPRAEIKGPVGIKMFF